MIQSLNAMIRREDGSAAIEMGIALPVLVMFIYAIFQAGLVFQANAGVQHALGEASRSAVVFPAPSDEDLAEEIIAKSFGTYNGTLAAATIATLGDEDGDPTGARTITLTYSQPTDLLFIDGPTVNITKSKTLWTAIGGGTVGTVTCEPDEDGDMACAAVE